jgi:hypothetical protein
MERNYFQDKIYNIDLYGIDFPIRYKSHRKASSSISLILSIISYILILTLIIIYLREVYQHSSLNVIICQKYLFEKYLLDFSNVPIFLGIKNALNELQEIDETYYSLKIETNENIPFNENNTRKNNETIINIEIEKCNFSLFSEPIFHQISENEKNYLYCIKPNQNLSFYGRYYDYLNGFKTIEILLLKCKNDTNNKNKCKSEKEINEKIQYEFLYFYYVTHKVNHMNISNPIQTFLRYEEFFLSQNYIKYYFYTFLPSIYTTTNNWILNKTKEYFFYEYHTTNFDFIEKNDFSNRIISVLITSNEYINHYYRSYTQLKDIIAKMGGTIDIIFILFQIITNYFSKKYINIELINNLITNDCKDYCENYYNNKIKLDYSYTEFKNSNFVFLNNNVSKIKAMTVKNKNSNIKIENININNNIDNDNSKNNNNLSTDLNLKENKIIINKNIKKFLDKSKLKKYSKQKLKYNWYEFLMPVIYFKKNNEFDLMNVFIDIFNNILSIENIIPLIERFYLFNNFSEFFNNNNILYIFNLPKNLLKTDNNNNNLEYKEETSEIVKIIIIIISFK